jgi:hypothetical protein
MHPGKISSEWRWNHWPLAGNDGISKFSVDASSYLALSLSRPDDEVHPNSFNYLTITIQLSINDTSMRRTGTTRDQTVNDQIFFRNIHATILVSSKHSSKLEDHLWFNIFLLSKALASRSLHLTTLEIIAQGSADIINDWNVTPFHHHMPALQDYHCIANLEQPRQKENAPGEMITIF